MSTCSTCRNFCSNPENPPVGFCRIRDHRILKMAPACVRHRRRRHYDESITVRTVRTVDPVDLVRKQIALEMRQGKRADVSGLKRGQPWIECDDPKDETATLTARVRAAIRLYGPIDAEGVAQTIGVENLKRVREAINVQKRRLRVRRDENGLWVTCGEA